MPSSATKLDDSQVSASKRHGRPRRTRVTIGGVSALVDKPSAEQVRRNIAESSSALERAAKRIVKPGIRLGRKKGVPYYSADPEHPEIFIRILDDKKERGFLVDGKFQVIA